MSHIVPRLLQTDKNDPMFSLNSPNLTSVDGAFVGVQDIAGATSILVLALVPNYVLGLVYT